MRNPRWRILWILVLATLAAPQAGEAVITFNQLDDDIFVISHRVKLIGSRGRATKIVYEKAASLCVAAGYSHLKILQQESEAAQGDDTANATLRAQFFFDDGEGRIGCEKNASFEYVEQASAKLAKRGYQPPERPSAGEPGVTAEAAGKGWACTIEQISGMVKLGLSDAQIKAACPN